MISINDFYLSKYRETEGREGYGYCAVLKHGKATAATYADYATGAMPTIDLAPGGEWRAALDQTFQELQAALPGFHIKAGSHEEQVETMCEWLYELREAHRGCRKTAGGGRYTVLLLVGDWWQPCPVQGDSLEEPKVVKYDLPVKVQDLATAGEWAAGAVKNYHLRKPSSKCAGVWIIDLEQEPKIALTAAQFADIFKLAKELS